MMFSTLRTATIGLLLAGAAPLLAQAASPPDAPAGAPGQPGAGKWGGPHGDRRGGGMFAGMSDAGQAIMRDAMKAGGDPRTEHDDVKAARERMLTLLDADTLDTSALKRAMDDERRAAQAGHDRRQAAMLAGFTKLSTADRKAFVANARAMKARMEARVGGMRGWGGRAGPRGPGGPGGPGGDMPPPPPPPMM